MKSDSNFLAKMHGATRLVQASNPFDATLVIQRALNIVRSPADSEMPHAKSMLPRPAPAPESAPLKAIHKRYFQSSRYSNSGTENSVVDAKIVGEKSVLRGNFLDALLTNHAGTRAYKIYVPQKYAVGGERHFPLIVMLHGCKQNPDDFAAGTMMNEIADEHDCFVVYPAQTQAKNMSQCWNWFNLGDQQRDGGEPSIIADITRLVMVEYKIDRRRVYVAGLSAGGAMAAIMGHAYPELFAAVGVHSGLAVGAARDVTSAFAAMKNGASSFLKPYSSGGSVARPIIIFQGDSDRTVHPKNAAQLLSQFALVPAGEGVGISTEQRKMLQGRYYTTIIYRDGGGQEIAEQWLVHGAGHAWSGGSTSGSYTDPKGPDASREMLRFFLAHPLRE